eukprot:365940-Chlamydomonas_euryale.AAC.21
MRECQLTKIRANTKLGHPYAADRLHLHMEYTGVITFNTRVCRGLDTVQAILEGRVAKLAGCSVDDVRAVAVVCYERGLNVSLKFDTPSCRIAAVNAVSLGLGVMQNILADPLENQYSLTLVSATPKLAAGMSFPPPAPPYEYTEDDWSYWNYYGDYDLSQGASVHGS